MKHGTGLRFAILLPAVLVSSSLQTASAATRTFKWSFQGQANSSAESAWASEQGTFGDMVRAATDGQVDIAYVANLCPDNQVLDAVRERRLNLGFMGLHYRPDMALMNFPSLPMVPDDRVPEILARLKPHFDRLWQERWGTKLLAFNYYLPQMLYTAEPADTLDRLRPQKIRQFNRDVMNLYARAGCAPVMIESVHAVRGSLERGTLQGAQGALPAYVDWGWAQRLRYISQWPLGSLYMALIVNMDDWNSLTPDLQRKLSIAAEELEKKQWKGRQAYVDGLLDRGKARYGSRVMNPPQTEVDSLLMNVGPILEDWKERVGPDSRTVLEAVNEVLGTHYK